MTNRTSISMNGLGTFFKVKGILLLSIIFILIADTYCHAQRVKISTSLGDITLQLEPDRAPITTTNYLRYVKEGFYRGGSFYRTVTPGNQEKSHIKIEVIQAGAHPWMQNFLYEPIPLERTRDTRLNHINGAISMARGGPDTACESFFICIGDQPELDYGGKRNPDGQGFAVFGHVISGMDVVQAIHSSNAEGQALMPPIIMHDVVILH